MRARRRLIVLGVASASLVTLGLALSPAPGPTLSLTVPQDPQAKAADGFHHGSHLPADWQKRPKAEQYRLYCSECHVPETASPGGLRRIEPKACASCHCNDPKYENSTDLLQFLPPAARSGPPSYDHALRGHQTIACIDCHQATPGPRGGRYPDWLFTVDRSLAKCAQCHQHGAGDPAHQFTASTGDGRACNECHEGQKPRLLGRRAGLQRPFSHTSHLPAASLAAPGDTAACRKCHDFAEEGRRVSREGVLQAADPWAFRVDRGDNGSTCARCHTAGPAQPPLQLERTPRTTERVASRFTHEQHKSEIDRHGCVGCHRTPPGAHDPEVDWRYTQCVVCHQNWKVEGHGTYSQCTRCHAGLGADAAKVATVEVRRSQPGRPSTFAFPGQHHPGITSRGSSLSFRPEDRQCSECHRNPQEALTRTARPFRHASHLGPLPTTKDCLVCHASVRESTTAKDLNGFAADDLFQAHVCSSCHVGEPLTFTPEFATVRVPAFGHAHHLAAGLQCQDCHGQTAEPADLRSAGLDLCKKCHGHDPGKPEHYRRTGPRPETPAAHDEDACSKCHVRHQARNAKAPPMPLLFTTRPVRTEQYALRSDQGRQYHEKAGKCQACHAFEKPSGRLFTELRDIKHKNLHSFGGPRDKGIPPEQLPTRQNGQVDCEQCHRRTETLQKYR